MSKRHYIIPLFVPHEGCPHDCVFCSQFKIATPEDNMDAQKATKIIEEHLSTIEKSDSTIEISFFGGTFTAIPMKKQRSLLEVAKKYKDSGRINYIRLSTRPDYINESILSHLKSYGVDIIELGVQSLDNDVLKAAGRGHTAEVVYHASKLIKAYGITLGHQIMPGLPEDTPDKDIKTVKESISMKPDICRIYPSLVIKSTAMETMYHRGMYKPYGLDEAIELCKKLYSLYYANNINVIRIGLQPTDNINLGGDIVAGPFHPAIRELVEGSLLNDMLFEALAGFTGNFDIHINARYISKLYADKKKYFCGIKEKLNNVKLKVILDEEIPLGEIAVVQNHSRRVLSISSYMKDIAKAL